MQAGTPAGNLHPASYLGGCACLSGPECWFGFLGQSVGLFPLVDCCVVDYCGFAWSFPAHLRFPCLLLDRRSAEPISKFSAVQGGYFCWRTHPWACKVPTLTTVLPAVLEDCFCSRVLCSPRGLSLLPSSLQSSRTASVFLVLSHRPPFPRK